MTQKDQPEGVGSLPTPGEIGEWTVRLEDAMSDIPRISRTVGEYQKRIDALACAINALTTEAPLSVKVAKQDALKTAQAQRDRHLAWLLEIAEKQGVDFVSIDCGTYHDCYEYIDGRWEGFVSDAR